MSAFVDTNVLVYAFDARDERKRARAIDILEGEGSLVLSTQVLSEFFVTVTRKLQTPLPVAEAQSVVERLSRLTVVPTDAPLVLAAMETSRVHQLSYWDALIIEAAAVSGCDVLLSEDLAAGSTLRGVTIDNPFVG